ncbi:MAG: DUF4244 domain-containing protein [Acidothermaceae bacterium]
MFQRIVRITIQAARVCAPLPRALARRIRCRFVAAHLQCDAGMSTAEYAIGTIAACAFAALLYKVITSAQILNLLSGVVSRALQVPF